MPAKKIMIQLNQERYGRVNKTMVNQKQHIKKSMFTFYQIESLYESLTEADVLNKTHEIELTNY